ncbi:radical SAM protein [Sphaerochaeta halotolerans]|jgi:MoaA/NifB/PqqE/SkfB family radical SAM enzyme|uniref:Radical SAM protein n=1 Tax=Sphaerochaeta halotolerans TaxID=2293840 RepID=A0A372MHI1_9SPIR|nr:radical SAM/SPASM domain-containing protein [Sphaerochaeta halotolerans]RFU95239.1 radical SAM protein [Sphaerochaeta halotolerans]
MNNSRAAKMVTRLAVSNKIVQKQVVKKLDSMFYESIVASGEDDIPAVAYKRYEWASSLLSRAVENINKGYISKHVIDRLSVALIDGAFATGRREAREKKVAEYRKTYQTNPPSFAVISPTQRCNLNCEGCYASSNGASTPSLPFETVDQIVTELEQDAGNRFVVISGGEPLMYEDKGKTLLDLFESHPDTFFMFYTNGVLIDDEMAKKLEKLGNGVPAISVEGFEKETDERRGRGVYKKILSAMESLRNVGMPFIVSVTSTSKNADLLLTDEFYETYFDKLGASFMWQFQLMPIGRGKEVFELMPDPETRVKLYRKWESLMAKKRYPMADFWNSGVLTRGCIAYGREGGYLYINWNGDIMPCVFVPYTIDNVKRLFAEGKHVGDALMSDMMRRGRSWQKGSQLTDAKNVDNLLMPCSIRDHYANFRANILTSDAHGENKTAEDILSDETYYRELVAYDERLSELTEPIWRKEYMESATEQQPPEKLARAK